MGTRNSYWIWSIFFVLVQFTSSRSRLVWTFGGFRYNIGGRLTSIVENICQDFTHFTGIQLNQSSKLIKSDDFLRLVMACCIHTLQWTNMKIQSFIHPDSCKGLKISPPPAPSQQFIKDPPLFVRATGRILRFQQMNVKVLLWCEGVDLSNSTPRRAFFVGFNPNRYCQSHGPYTPRK